MPSCRLEIRRGAPTSKRLFDRAGFLAKNAAMHLRVAAWKDSNSIPAVRVPLLALCAPERGSKLQGECFAAAVA
jgi:hypothetical protein